MSLLGYDFRLYPPDPKVAGRCKFCKTDLYEGQQVGITDLGNFCSEEDKDCFAEFTDYEPDAKEAYGYYEGELEGRY